jgi:hypothetical protein
VGTQVLEDLKAEQMAHLAFLGWQVALQELEVPQHEQVQ